MIIINADDWGRSEEETDVSYDCYRLGRVTSVSAMVFMADSERAAQIARTHQIPTGLHLNFSEPFAVKPANSTLADHHRRIVRFLNSSRLSHLLYHPLLVNAFEYVFRAQVDEFQRLYGTSPTHFDGHQHMHLCGNMLAACPIPRGEKVRRSFSFESREKSLLNRQYRELVNRRLSGRYRLTDYFFSLSQQMSADRFTRVCNLASARTVELMAHPVRPAEAKFLLGEEYENMSRKVSKGSYIDL